MNDIASWNIIRDKHDYDEGYDDYGISSLDDFIVDMEDVNRLRSYKRLAHCFDLWISFH